MEGLNKKDVEYRINNGLVNDEEIKNSRSLKEIILSNLLTLFNFIHLVLFILVLTTGSIQNTTFVIAIIFNILIGIYQEIKAKIIIDKLKIVSADKVTVVRDGEKKEIRPTEILMDDLLYLKPGDSLVVDAKVVESDNLEVDESIITGESEVVIKKENDSLISGSIINAGYGYAKVVSINSDTYANKMIKEASKNTDNSSYLMRNINNILKVVTVLIIPVGILLFITQFFYSNQTYAESVLSSVAGVIGMIPDGLVLLTSISLTVGVIKMASKKVIIQKLSGIELLACVDTLCLDKTGTITDGSMKVMDVIYKDNDKDKINNIIANMVNDCGNATNKALYDYFKVAKDMSIIKQIPFSSARKYSLTKFEDGTYALGACEFISNKKITDYQETLEYLDNGYRIITLVKCPGEFNKEKNKILAFIIIKDNIRKSAKETLNYFKEQDVDIKIISGDNPQTVSNLLKQLSIEDYDKYISGVDLPEDFKELEKIVNNYKIFGRVTPQQKKAIVAALKKSGTVGYIGDGVNDILALKESDCGIALASGISAARSVSEVVLTDSDFSILPGIVNEGRRVVNNIERVASMYLVKTTYSFLLSLLCIFLNHEYPFYPIQLSLISAICVGIPSFFLAIEPNYTKVKKGFLVKVFRNALPSGICVFINIFFLIMIAYIFKIDFDVFRIVVVATTGYINLRLLYNISKPLSLIRKILVYSCFIAFYGLLIIFRDLLLINKIKFISFLFIALLIFADIYLTEFFESIYDFIVKTIIKWKNKRSRVSNEK
ncbi:MAG: HAD-IC family P-type ATPase [Bacilli bacterium]